MSATILDGNRVVLEPLAQLLGSVVEAIPERLVQAFEDISPGHEDPLERRRARPRVRRYEYRLQRHGRRAPGSTMVRRWLRGETLPDWTTDI